jgi:cytochrome c peroxidase
MTSGKSKKAGALIAALALLAAGWWSYGPRSPASWSEADLATLQSLSIDSLPPLPPDASNAVADDRVAARLGHRLFFDTRLSANGAVSCATCHQPERRFTDGLAKGRGIGLSGRNSRSIVGTAYSPWLYWDGRRDSQWAQALSPLEDPAEHGGNRMQLVRIVANDSAYRHAYERLFGPLPDFGNRARFPDAAAPIADPAVNAAWQSMTPEDQHVVNEAYANIGKAIAAYERLLIPGPSRFDAYVRAVLSGNEKISQGILSNEEVLGLQLFIDEARCTECHNGPLFTNHEFHNTGVLSFPGELPDRGRINGVRLVREDLFNCLGAYSDDPERNCAELVFVRTGIELIGATRTPSLRNLGGTAPYSHKGQHETLASLLDHYNRAPLALIGHNEVENALGLSRRELKWLEAFLSSLDAPLPTEPEWLAAPE